jgi:methyl-accepting chemotaxis protein
MSDKQIKMLFAKLEELSGEIAEMKESVAKAVASSHSAAANSQLVLSGYQEHGTVIELLERKMERLVLRCPLMKPDTQELEKLKVGGE